VALFNRWSPLFIELAEETWVAADGKSIKSTLSDYSASYQNFITQGKGIMIERVL
jgi:hypothetical protein